MSTPASISYTPFVRQYRDWYVYDQRGNFYLSFRFKLGKVDRQRINSTIDQLLYRREILRAIFELDQHGQLVYRLLPVQSPLLAPTYIDIPANDIHERQLQIEKENEGIPLHEGPMVRSFVFTQGKPFVVVYLNHIVANASSAELLKAEFKQLYSGQTLAGTPTFDDFARAANKKLLQRYNNTVRHLQAVFNPVDPAIISQVKQPPTADQCHSWLSKVQYHTINTPASAKPMYYDLLWHISDFDAVSELLPSLNITWYSLLLSVYRRAIASLGMPQKLIGLLFDYRYSKHSANNIGEFTGEAYVPIEAPDSTLQQIQRTNQWLIKTSAHLIFNYSLYNIDEPRLYKHCIGFFNFKRTNLKFQDLSHYDNPGIIDFLGFVLEPIMTLHPCGTLHVHWRFDANIISAQQIEELNQQFGQSLHSTIEALQTQYVAQLL